MRQKAPKITKKTVFIFKRSNNGDKGFNTDPTTTVVITTTATGSIDN